PAAAVFEHLETIQLCLGRHALLIYGSRVFCVTRQCQSTGDDCRDVGAMAMAIQRAKTTISWFQLPGIATACAIPLCNDVAVCLEMRVVGSDSGIEHRPGDIPATSTITEI